MEINTKFENLSINLSSDRSVNFQFPPSHEMPVTWNGYVEDAVMQRRAESIKIIQRIECVYSVTDVEFVKYPEDEVYLRAKKEIVRLINNEIRIAT